MNASRIPEIVRSAALLCASLSFTVFAGEVALRATGYRPTLADPDMYVANDHEYLPYRMRPGYRGYYMGKEVRLDADGFRVVPRPARSTGRSGRIDDGTSSVMATTLAPTVEGTTAQILEGATAQIVKGTAAQNVKGTNAQNVKGTTTQTAEGTAAQTVLLLGDSVVFGHGLAAEEAPAAQLQELFDGVYVRAAGVSGYTSWNELAVLEEYVGRHAVDAVVLVYLENDITFDHNQLRLTDGTFGNIGSSVLHGITQWTYRHVYLTYLVRNAVERMKRAVAATDTPPPTEAAASPLDKPAFAHSLEALRRIQALCSREGIAFTVGIYRDVTYYDDRTGVLRYETRLAEHLANAGIESFVIGSHVETLDLEAARLSWNDPHPTAEAVGLFVEDIYGAALPLVTE